MRRYMPVLLVGLLATGCATKKYVGGQVGEVNAKVDALSRGVESTQAANQRNETRIEEVDKQAKTGITEARESANQAMTKATDAERAAKGKLLYSVTLSNDKVTFPLNRALLSDEAKQLVDSTVGPIVADNRGVFIEIEGHTDSTGPAQYNTQLGEDRAVAVRNYLRDNHQIALNRMEVISYGEEKPVTDNKTKANRATNRRVVINVLE